MPRKGYVSKRPGRKTIYQKPTGRPAHRPLKFNDEMRARVINLARCGFNETQLCEIVNIAQFTLNRWKKRFPSFCEEFIAARTQLQEEGCKAGFKALYKQKLRKQRITKTIDENGKEVTRKEVIEEEIPPNAAIILKCLNKLPIFQEANKIDSRGTFTKAFDDYSGYMRREAAESSVSSELDVTEAEQEFVSQSFEDQYLGGSSPFG